MKTTSDLIFLLFSVLIHLLLALILLFRIFIFPSERPEFIQSVRVDFVALPDKNPTEGTKSETLETPDEKVEKPTPVKTEAPLVEAPSAQTSQKVSDKKDDKIKSTEKIKDKKPKAEKEPEKLTNQQSASLDRLKALTKIKNIKNQKEAAKAAADAQLYKGNVLSEGTSLTGVDKLQHDQYLAKLDIHIKNNWKLPAWLTDKPYTTAVLVRFEEKGLVLDKKIVRSSGNAAYDAEALQAVANSVPFPEPPEHLVNYFKVRGIELRFPE